MADARERGLYTNFRFSPGYGDLPMETQPILLAALDAQRRLGITLAPKSLLMTPTKSVTAVVGMSVKPASSHASCADCLCRDFCRMRGAGTPCWKR